jgi:DNA-directed RNA polymerase specialized sigma24 family protein
MNRQKRKRPVRNGKWAIRVKTKHGVRIYKSIKHAAVSFGLEPSTVAARLRRGKWTPEQALELAPPPQNPNRAELRPVTLTVNGRRHRYKSISEAARARGLNPMLVLNRVNGLGWSIDQALEAAPRPRNSSPRKNYLSVDFETGGARYRFPSVSYAARSQHLDPALVFNRLRNGWALPQALELEPRTTSTKTCYGYIYVVTHDASGKKYVGQTRTTIERRWQGHIQSALKAGQTRDRALSVAIRAYGPTAFSIRKVAEAENLQVANDLERQWIEKLETRAPNGFNSTRGGGAAPLPGRAVAVKGVRYASIAAAARAHGLKPNVVGDRLDSGWSPEQACGLEAAPTWARRPRELVVTVAGKVLRFKSVSSAARFFGVSYEAASGRLDSGWSIEEAFEIVPPSRKYARKPISFVRGGQPVSFSSLAAAAKAMGLDRGTVAARLKKGWLLEEALGVVPRSKKPVQRNRFLVKVDGATIAFPSHAEAARAYGVPPHRLSRRLRAGWSIEQALGVLPPPPSRNTVRFQHDGQEYVYSSVGEAAKAHGLREGTVTRRLASGRWTLQQALGLEPAPSSPGDACTVRKDGRQKTYSSLRQAARAHGMEVNTVRHRLIQMKWTIEQALDLAPPPRPPAVLEFKHEGVAYQYSSIREAAQAHSLKEATVNKRLRKYGWTPQQALGLARPPLSIEFIHKRSVYRYQSISDAARAHRLPVQRVLNRLATGKWSMVQALGLEPPPQRRTRDTKHHP